MKIADIEVGRKYVYKFRNMITNRPDHREVRVLAINVPVRSYPANQDEPSRLSQGGILVVETGDTKTNHRADKGRVTIVQPQHIVSAVEGRRANVSDAPETVETNGRVYEVWYRVEKRGTEQEPTSEGWRYVERWRDAGGPVRDFRLPTRKLAEQLIAGRHDLIDSNSRIVAVKVRVKNADRTLVSS